MKHCNINEVLDIYSKDIVTKILEDYKGSGKKVIGYTCIYVPEELILAGGFQPYRIFTDKNVESRFMPSFICPTARAILNNIFNIKDNLEAIVISHTCDPMWRLYDIVKRKVEKPTFLLRIPHNIDDLAKKFFLNELNRLREFIEKISGEKIYNDQVIEAVELCNHIRAILRNLYIKNKKTPKLSSYELFSIIFAATTLEKEGYLETIKKLNILNRPRIDGIRLHVSGSSLFNLELFKLIDECGGLVVSDDLCTGSRYLDIDIRISDNNNIIKDLSDGYLERPPCPAIHPITARLNYIRESVASSNIKGVIVSSTSSCDPMLYDYVHIRDMLKKSGIRVALIDYENVSREKDRIKSRIKAFIESIGG